jgi:phenylacetate-CoA ligase
MYFMQKLRKTAFWSLDFIKGAPVRKHFEHISTILKDPTSDASVKETTEALNKLLNFTITHIPYYRKKELPLELQAFPVTDKNLIRTRQEQFLLPGIAKEKLIKVTTSGSTGAPFTVYQSKDKKNRNTADVIYFAQQSGFELGNTLYYMRHWDLHLKKGKLQAFLQNIIPLEASDFQDDYLENFLEVLTKDRSPKAFIGYPSCYSTLVNYLQRTAKKPQDYGIHSIIATSEALPKLTKELMEYYFKCPVVSRYSNMENGIIAQQLPSKSNEFYLNTASYIVETLDLATNKPVEGVPGKIVVTDLYNYTMPLLRYDTGDIGVLATDSDTGLKKLTRIDGRQMDVIMNTKGEIISSFVAVHTIKYPGILQTQLIQEGAKQYKFKLCVTEDFKEEAAIRAEYLDTLGSDAIITFEYVNEIPLLRSGKRKVMVNNYLKSLKDFQK